ncbi:MAG: Maf-like protein [Prevotellaceae bacterium]|jgi:septum formation protein|nr:Maf-like protein [Prevotellaceae bacterium]
MLENYKIILGSQSPRRQELLKGLDIDFEVKKIDVEETYPPDLQIDKVPEYLAKQKSDAYKSFLDENTILITADTIVVLDNQAFGKPKDYSDAFLMLKKLAGKTHEVITGVCITTKQRQEVFSVVTKVTFSPLSDDEIGYYLTKYAPYDKAGSYGIQEWVGFVGVEKIEGSFYNVMGLPIQKIYQELKKF